MADAVKQRALRPRRAVNYTAEGACDTPLWLSNGIKRVEVPKKEVRHVATHTRALSPALAFQALAS